MSQDGIKAYITAIIVVFVGATILASQKIIALNMESTQILLGAGVIVGICVIAHEIVLTQSVRKQKKLIQ